MWRRRVGGLAQETQGLGTKCIQNHGKSCGFCKSRPSRAGETTAKCIPTAFLQYFVTPLWHANADAPTPTTGN